MRIIAWLEEDYGLVCKIKGILIKFWSADQARERREGTEVNEIED